MSGADFNRIVARKFYPPDSGHRGWTFLHRPAFFMPGATLIILCACLWFLLSTAMVPVQVKPAEAEVKLDTWRFLYLNGNLLATPGEYRVSVHHPGYFSLENHPLTISAGDNPEQVFTLRKLPGIVNVVSKPEGASVFLEERYLGQTPLTIAANAGTRIFRLALPEYQQQEHELVVMGMGETQNLDIALPPDWADYTIRTDPPDADVQLAGIALGVTPGTFRIPSGEQQIMVSKPGYQSVFRQVSAIAETSAELPLISLQKNAGIVRVTSEPSGSNVLIDKNFYGQTPISIPLKPDVDHKITLIRSNFDEYSRVVNVATDQTISLHAILRARLSQVIISVTPEDAEILIDGKPVGRGGQVLNLPAVEHLLEARHPDYANWKRRITPQPGLQRRVVISMQTPTQVKMASLPSLAVTSAGQEMILVRSPPITIQMGASLREEGYQRNQSRRSARIDKPFYLSSREVTNAEFRQFRNMHSSGSFEQADLNRDDHPAVRISWSDAAAYCNWLSAQEGYTPVYVFSDDHVSSTDITMNGYRLPTEAEWVLVARRSGKNPDSIFPWGNLMPPSSGAGNYADKSASHILSLVINDYDDGFVGTAPIGSYPANSLGLFDLGGNVAEWMHDRYQANARQDTLTERPGINTHRVIRGSSWQSGTLVELRLAYRRFGFIGEPDVGFRLARTPES